MPITEGKFTAEEFDAAITANPELLKEAIPSLTKREYFVADKVAKESYETTLKSGLTLEHATRLEKDVETITGIKKNDGEKYYDYNKRVLAEVKKVETLNTELATLRGTANLTETEKQRLAALETGITERDTQIKTLKTDYESKLSLAKRENTITYQISKVKLKTDPILKEAIGIVSEKVIAEMVAASREENGKTIFIAEDGKTIMLNHDLTVMNAEQYFTKRMDKFVDNGKVITGAGGTVVEDDPVVGQFATQAELGRFLSKKGLVSGTKEFTKEFDRLSGSKLPKF